MRTAISPRFAINNRVIRRDRDPGDQGKLGLEARKAGEDPLANGGVMALLASPAQRDVIDWTLTEASARAGLKDEALALAHERLALRPESAPNKRFLREAEAIAG